MAKKAAKTPAKKAGSKPAPKPKKPAKKATAEKAPKAAAAADEKRVNIMQMSPEEKALFMGKGGHLEQVIAARAKLATANSNLRKLYKTAKADGFLKPDFDVAVSVGTPEGEAKIKSDITRILRVARAMGSDLGEQLDMFAEPVRKPAADRAYDEGQNASLQGLTLTPPYDPSTEQYREFARGWHDDQERRMKAGFTKKEDDEIPTTTLIPKADKDAKAAAKVKAAADRAEAKAGTTHGIPTSRSEFLARQQAQNNAKTEADALFNKKPEPERLPDAIAN